MGSVAAVCGLSSCRVWASVAAVSGLSSCHVWASVAAVCGLSRCGAQAELSLSIWDLPRPGIKPVSPVLAGRFFTTEAPGKSCIFALNICIP